MKRSLSHLRLSEQGAQASFARLWNKLISELERQQVHVVPPLIIRENGDQGRTLSLIQRGSSATAGGGGFVPRVQVHGANPDITGTPDLWVFVNLNDNTAAYNHGPPVFPSPNLACYEVAVTYGPIVIP